MGIEMFKYRVQFFAASPLHYQTKQGLIEINKLTAMLYTATHNTKNYVRIKKQSSIDW
jgi:hypothetical protein